MGNSGGSNSVGQSRRKICHSLCDKQWATGTLRASSVRRFFTIPKILRHSFKFDKRLFGEVSKLIFSLLSEFFSLAAGQELLCACVISYQSFGEFARFHPHWHVMALEGGFTRYDRFVYLPIGADEGILRVWQATMLALFLQKKLIDQTRVNILKDFKHSGFSIESETRLLSTADREALGQYVVRGATCAEKIHYDEASDTVVWTASPKGVLQGQGRDLQGLRVRRPESCCRRSTKLTHVSARNARG